MSPGHAGLRAEGRLAHLRMLGGRREAGEVHVAQARPVRGTKHRADVANAADVVEEGGEGRPGVLLHRRVGLVRLVGRVDELGSGATARAFGTERALVLDGKPQAAILASARPETARSELTPAPGSRGC